MYDKLFKFSKYEGAGNDIIIFDFFPEKIAEKPARLAEFIRFVGHRFYGIGADEICFVKPKRSGGDIAAVKFYNSDGSPAEVCGNALRCIAKHLFEKGKSKGHDTFSLHTDAGSRKCSVVTDESGHVGWVTVQMGKTRRPDGVEGLPENVRIEIEGKKRAAVQLSMGNPHVVLLAKYSWERMERIGSELQKHKLFPSGVNVGFATVKSAKRIDLVVYERGCGFTLACGSGACAAAAAAAFKGKCRYDTPIDVNLPGGNLAILVKRKTFVVNMAGPANRVFTGTLDNNLFKYL